MSSNEDGGGAWLRRRRRWDCFSRTSLDCSRIGMVASGSLSSSISLFTSSSSPLVLYRTALQLGHVLFAALPESSHCRMHVLPKTHWHSGCPEIWTSSWCWVQRWRQIEQMTCSSVTGVCTCSLMKRARVVESGWYCMVIDLRVAAAYVV